MNRYRYTHFSEYDGNLILVILDTATGLKYHAVFDDNENENARMYRCSYEGSFIIEHSVVLSHYIHYLKFMEEHHPSIMDDFIDRIEAKIIADRISV